MRVGGIDTQIGFIEDFLHSRSRLPVGIHLRGGHVSTNGCGGVHQGVADSGSSVFQGIRGRVMVEGIAEM